MKLFLGGTCNKSTWRDELIKLLEIDYFNPVVDDWTQECKEEEIKQRQECDFVLYCITPKMIGFYSIAEAVDDSNKRPNKTIFCILETDTEIKFNAVQIKSLRATKQLLLNNGSKVFSSLFQVASYLNNKKE